MLLPHKKYTAPLIETFWFVDVFLAFGTTHKDWGRGFDSLVRLQVQHGSS